MSIQSIDHALGSGQLAHADSRHYSAPDQPFAPRKERRRTRKKIEKGKEAKTKEKRRGLHKGTKIEEKRRRRTRNREERKESDREKLDVGRFLLCFLFYFHAQWRSMAIVSFHLSINEMVGPLALILDHYCISYVLCFFYYTCLLHLE